MVTINISLGSGADERASKGLIKIRPVEELSVGNYLALTDWKPYALSSEPIAREFTAGALYESDEVEPRGKRRVFQAPAETTDYKDLNFLKESGAGSGIYVADQFTWVLLSTDPLPADAQPGQTYYETDTDIVGEFGA